MSLPGIIALNNSFAYTAAGLAGLGVVQMANVLMAPMIEEGRYVSILEEWTNDPLPLHVVYPQNRHLSAKVRAFVEWIANCSPGTRCLAKAAPIDPGAETASDQAAALLSARAG